VRLTLWLMVLWLLLILVGFLVDALAWLAVVGSVLLVITSLYGALWATS
jgi:hypothetical protein